MVALTNAPTASKLRLTFSYDYQDRRISKSVESFANGASWNMTLSNKFVYDGWNLVGELDGTNNAVTREYMWGTDLSATIDGAGGVGGLLAVSSPGLAQFTCCDGNGNVSVLIDSATASISGRYEYGPFGEDVRVSGAVASANPIRFSTKYADPETDLLYYGYRYYDPRTESWISADLIEEQGGLNLYGFVANDPVNEVDAFGLWKLYDKLEGKKAIHTSISLKRILNLPGQNTTFTKIANAIADAIEPASFDFQSDSYSFGTTADPQATCSCVDLKFQVTGDLDKTKGAVGKLLNGAFRKAGLPGLDVSHYGGNLSANGRIEIKDCKGFSRSQVEIKGGPIEVEAWFGYNYSLKKGVNLAGAKTGAAVLITLQKPAITEIGDDAQIKFPVTLRLKAGSEASTVLVPGKKPSLEGFDKSWGASLQVYPIIAFSTD
jgi:RHS repeat-associated protein